MIEIEKEEERINEKGKRERERERERDESPDSFSKVERGFLETNVTTINNLFLKLFLKKIKYHEKKKSSL